MDLNKKLDEFQFAVKPSDDQIEKYMTELAPFQLVTLHRVHKAG